MSNPIPIRIAIADDHEVFRDGLLAMIRKIPSLECVGEAENGKELLEIIKVHQPDVVLTDIKMPVMDGITLTKIVAEEFPATSIIALSMIDEEIMVNDMLVAGAKGYLVKNAHKDQILEAIRTVYNGHHYYCSHTISIMSGSLKRKFDRIPEARDIFSERELQIIELVCSGLTSKEMAAKIHLSARTIDSHRVRIMEKMDVRNVAGIINYAITNKIYQVGKK